MTVTSSQIFNLNSKPLLIWISLLQRSFFQLNMNVSEELYQVVSAMQGVSLLHSVSIGIIGTFRLLLSTTEFE